MALSGAAGGAILNRERLTRLATKLLAHHDNGVRFNLRRWVLKDCYEPSWCGTSACAVGLACLDPEFNAEGLVLGGEFPRFLHHVGWEAVNAFFGLTYQQSEHLFYIGAYPLSKQTGEVAARAVAARIMALVAS